MGREHLELSEVGCAIRITLTLGDVVPSGNIIKGGTVSSVRDHVDSRAAGGYLFGHKHETERMIDGGSMDYSGRRVRELQL